MTQEDNLQFSNLMRTLCASKIVQNKFHEDICKVVGNIGIRLFNLETDFSEMKHRMDELEKWIVIIEKRG